MATAAPRRRRARRSGGADLVRLVVLTLFLVFVLVPLYWMVMTSVKPTSDYMTIPPVWFPKEPTLVHYTAALFSYRGLQGLTNSLIVASAATVLSSLLGTMMAYSLARFNTGGQHLAFWVLSQRFLPPVAIILPIFLLFRGWGLYDTHVGLILIYTFMTLPLTVWMMYAYFRQLPRSLEEAALVDGASTRTVFLEIVLPMVTPGIAATAILCFLYAWNDFFFALILTRTNARTAPVAVVNFMNYEGWEWGRIAAGGTMIMLPVLVFSFLVRRYLVHGLTGGALKG